MVYLYNPFTGLLFARFIERLLRSLERRPRPLRLVYNYPFEHDYVIATRPVPADRPLLQLLARLVPPAGLRDPHLRGAHARRQRLRAAAGRARPPARLGPVGGRHDPGWELVGPEHATAADARSGPRARGPARLDAVGVDRQLLVGDRLERAPVQVADAELRDRGAVLGRRVADVRVEVPAGQLLARSRCM